jgi:outer membrane protein assembly factor BamB
MELKDYCLDIKIDNSTKILVFLGILLIGSIIFSGTVCAASTGNLSQPKFHNNTGQSEYTGPQTNTTKWKYNITEWIYSSPSIGSNGTIYIGSNDNNLYAINPNGTLKWKYTMGDGIESTPAIGSDGTIYVGCLDCNLYAINPNGTQKWNYTTNKLIWASPFIGTDGTIYIGSYDGNLYALNPDGTQKWKYTTDNAINTSPVIGSDGTIYIGSNDNNLYALYPNGTQKWKYTTGSALEASPSIGSDGTIYIGSDEGNLYAINPNGTLKWKFKTNNLIGSTPAVGSDGTIYIGSWDDNLYAINPNGTQKWKYTTNDWIFSSPTIGRDGTIYIGSKDKNLYAINPNGTQKWKYTTNDRIESSATIATDGTLYIASFDHNLYAITDINVTPSIPGGNYNKSVVVGLQTNLPGTIYYKLILNGSSANWLKYTEPLTIKKSSKLSFYAMATDGNSSPINTVTYSINYPVPTVTASPKGGIYNTKQIVTLKTVSSTNIYYTLDGTNPQKSNTRKLYKSPITINKTTLLKYSAITSTETWSPNYTQKYTIDKIAPRVIPSHAGRVSLYSPLIIKFNKNIYTSTNINKIYLKNRSNGKYVKISKSIKGNTIIIKHTKLTKNNKYTVYIPRASVKDHAGNQLKTVYSTKFMTKV